MLPGWILVLCISDLTVKNVVPECAGPDRFGGGLQDSVSMLFVDSGRPDSLDGVRTDFVHMLDLVASRSCSGKITGAIKRIRPRYCNHHRLLPPYHDSNTLETVVGCRVPTDSPRAGTAGVA